MKKNVWGWGLLPLCLWAQEDDWALNNSFTMYADFAYFRSDHSHDFETGVKTGFSYMTHHTAWDVFYLWLDPWEERGSKSEFQNGELNFFRYISPRHDDFFGAGWMVGLRYMRLHDHRKMNKIPAIQAGGTLAWNPTRKLTWDLLLKAGVGFDEWRDKTWDKEKKRFSTPFVGEAGVTLSYQVVSYLNFHASYQAIYLNRVALSHEHRDKAHASLLIHGLTAGLGLSF